MAFKIGINEYYLKDYDDHNIFPLNYCILSIDLSTKKIFDSVLDTFKTDKLKFNTITKSMAFKIDINEYYLKDSDDPNRFSLIYCILSIDLSTKKNI